ncbi:DUF2515 family protein [Neobacillus cucumis]|uniref:DUF2515 family protein n=1 Tax=Neobacillus cucumis TaxID=1740721 RepID=UPI0028535A82|nr:DUF2515 family protein [Neobacillus cucumis]MDR4948142.1 DUF2515 family protein [Neobacillus cucumis]
MTDLKGEFLTRLMTKKDRVLFFQFLERGNWLIFQDAYPQFLLYEESLRLKENEKIVNGEIKDEYCKTLERLELAALAKKAITF